MDKKPLIVVSILAVVLLVLGSLSNVVGYQSVKSTVVNDSPLFSTRTQRANNQEQNIITSRYLGMEKETHIYLPDRDKRIKSINVIFNYIKRMDDKSLRRLAFLIQYNLPKNNEIKEFNQGFDTEEIFQGLKELRDNPEINIQNIQKSMDSKATENICAYTYGPMNLADCLVIFFIVLILGLIAGIFFYFPLALISIAVHCEEHTIIICEN